MNKIFETIEAMKDFLSDIGIDISISELKYSIKTGNIFLDDYEFNCYYDEENEEYVLEG